jgi:serine protease Do
MIKRLLQSGVLLLTAGCITVQVAAQSSRETPSEKKEESITIRKKGDTKEKMTIVIDGDQITVNGKPVDEFKSDNIEIDRNKRIYRPMAPRMPLGPGGPKMFRGDVLGFSSNKAFLGVTSEKTTEGAKVTAVTKGSPADKAGLKKDDVITKVGDTKVEDSQDLYEAIGQYKPEDKVSITYKREGKEAVAQATLGKNEQARTFRFNNGDFDFKFPDDLGNGFNYFRKPRVGLQVQDTEDGKGVKVLDVTEDTPADKAGLKKGDVITGVNGKDIHSVDELRDVTDDLEEGASVQLKYNRNNQSQTAEIKIPRKLKTSNL